MKSIKYKCSKILLGYRSQIVHFIELDQSLLKEDKLTILLSKHSEAINSYGLNNQIGEGATLSEVIQKQQGIRLIINAGFNHYRHNFYNWPHNKFEIGDPVGIVKIREHYFEDVINSEHYGYFVQENKHSNWHIFKDKPEFNCKYILGCTPLLIFNKKAMIIPNEHPLPENVINPPSYLGHGNQIHPRTAVAIKNSNIVFIVVENNEYDNGGCTLSDLQNIGLKENFDAMLNLDGGGSTQFKFINEHNETISNFINNKDKNRILGHSLIVFDENLKNIKNF